MLVRLAPILGITFIDILGFSILIPLLPYFVKHFGVGDVVVGFLFTAFALTQFIGSPLWGNLSDRIGRKKVLIISQVGAAIGWGMLGWAPTIIWVFVARIVEGISGGNISVTKAYVADLVEPEKRGRAFGYIGATFSGGLIFGPAIGGFLVDRYGFSAPFYAAAALQIVTLIATIIFLPESLSKTEETTPATFPEIVRSLKDPRVAPVLVQDLFNSMGLYGWFSVFALIVGAQLHFGPGDTSRMFSVFGVFSVIMQIFVVGRLTDTLGNRMMSNAGFASLIIAFGFAPFMHNLWGAALLVATFSFGMSHVNATIPALLTEGAPANMRGTILGSAASLEASAGIFMPPISTGVLGTVGTAGPAAISASFVAIALALGIRAQLAATPIANATRAE
ncbi:MAG TPA: MFS transporter [Candidatus Baltobacteraceae bacterium]